MSYENPKLSKMDLGDPELELIDPAPNVHALFIHFDELFFWQYLGSRTVVRWSKRMYSCAGICYYKNRICDIALSEPLLKLRPRKDLVETLLHEMIHAYLFITSRDLDRDGHGPIFQSHMKRINQAANLNISIYHDFHDEVESYATHWWRCNGPCQAWKPHFGIVRRTMNRAPGYSDRWFASHQRQCGGTFIKIKEPCKSNKKPSKAPPPTGKTNYITDYIHNTTGNMPAKTPVLNVNNNITAKGNVKTNNKKTVDINPTVSVFTGNGHTIGKSKSNMADVIETVRSIWTNKPIILNKNNKVGASNPNKHKSYDDVTSPPAKIKKIDDYFKTTAASVLKDLYGDSIEITQANDTNKLIAVSVPVNSVDCPICNAKINKDEINRHIDECLNKDIIEELSKTDTDNKPDTDRKQLKDLGNIPQIPAFKGANITIDLTRIKTETGIDKIKENNFKNIYNSKDDIFLNRKPTNNSQSSRKSDNFITKSGGDTMITKSGDSADVFDQSCPCCGKEYDKPIQEHLEECLMFFDNDSTSPEDGASTSHGVTIVIDDDDLDESLLLNETGTKFPCPCCMQMIEQADMNDHLDVCLKS